MRFRSILISLAIVLSGVTAAAAQASIFYAERGHWMVAKSGTNVCRATNRPAEDFNFSPFNALQIVVRSGQMIGVEVMFWPQAIDPGRDYRLVLRFDNGEPISLNARASLGDFALASEAQGTGQLWRAFQGAKSVTVSVDEAPKLQLLFTLDDGAWLPNTLQQCARLLAKP
jgi:hypothetical protein